MRVVVTVIHYPGAPPLHRRSTTVQRGVAQRCAAAQSRDENEQPEGGWTAAADQLIGAGVTRLGRDKLALVLAELDGGAAPSTIAHKVGVGYARVARIAQTTKRLH